MCLKKTLWLCDTGMFFQQSQDNFNHDLRTSNVIGDNVIIQYINTYKCMFTQKIIQVAYTFAKKNVCITQQKKE